MNAVYLVGGILSILTVLVWIGLLIWGAVEDGRDQKRHSSPPRR